MIISSRNLNADNNSESSGRTLRQMTWQYVVYLLILSTILIAGSYALFQVHWQQFINNQHNLLDAIDSSRDVESYLARLNVSSPHVYLTRDSGIIDIAGNSDPITSADMRWYRRLTFESSQRDNVSGITQNPDGQLWIYTTDNTIENQTRIILQPFINLLQIVVAGMVILAIIVILAAISPYIFWRALEQRIISPLYDLTDISEAIRWRGHLHDEERERLSRIIDADYDTRILAGALMAMEEEISHRFFQLSTLLNTSQIVVSSLRTEEVLNTILVEVQSLFECDRCAIVTLDKEHETFRIQASLGLSPHYVEHLNIMPSEPNSPSMRALRNREPIQIVDTETDLGYKAFRHRSRRENFRSVMSIPLTTTHTPPSVLNLYKDEPYRYSFSERELAISFGNHASLALENATLFQQTDDQVKLQTRRLVAIMESMTDPLILESDNHEITYMNSQAYRLPGITNDKANNRDEIFESLLTCISNTNDRDRYLTAYEQPGNRSVDVEIGVAGIVKDMRIQFFDVRDSSENHLGRGQMWQDISKDKQLDRMKSSLVSTVSHELRTPLATIKGYVTTLLADDVQWDADNQRHFLNTILKETNRLAELVSSILDLSQIESGLIKIYPQMVSLNEIVSLVLTGFPPDARERIQVQFDKTLPATMMDAQRIGTVIRNLIDNAVKYAPQSTISVVTLHQDTDIICSVKDTGDGIHAADKEKIFERFYRSEDGLSRKSSGFGLGLAISKGFIDAHNGEIWFESDTKGTTFSFSLPVK